MRFLDLSYTPSKNDLICEFRIEPARSLTIKEVAEKIASESSVGTWTKLYKLPKRVEKIKARIFEITGKKIKIAYPLELFELGNMPQILSSIAGNIFGMKAVKNLRLEDVRFPRKIVKSFKGPQFGIEGVRKIFGVFDRPLIGTIVKPKLGFDSKMHASIAYEAWKGGCDLLKDDENLTSQKFNTFERRIRETLRKRRKVEEELGDVKCYLPNITAETKEMIKRAKLVQELGGRYVMIDILTSGFAALQTVREECENLKLVIHAHRAMHAAFTRNKKHGISMLVIAKIARLIGVDQLHTGTVVGKLESRKKDVIEINNFLRDKWYNTKSTFPVASGGLHPGIIPEVVKLLGKDTIIQLGGGIHGHPLGTESGAKAARQSLEAYMEGIPLSEYAKTHKELRLALEKWGYKKPR